MRRDFVALYTAGQAARKYIDYKQVDKDKEGQAEGAIEFVAPAKPGHYFARYLRADYTELAVSATIVVRSALSVLLEEVKNEGAFVCACAQLRAHMWKVLRNRHTRAWGCNVCARGGDICARG
jgi:hypothetical protein